jgi:hypothetical protein
MSEKIKITNIEFEEWEWNEIKRLARHFSKPKKIILDQVTPQNIIRMAVQLPVKKRGGARPNTGNRQPKTERESA